MPLMKQTKKSERKIDNISTRGFVCAVIIVVTVTVSIFLALHWTLHPTNAILVPAIASVVSAEVPTLLVLWISVYSDQARMVRMTNMDFMRKERMEHYKLIGDQFFSEIFVEDNVYSNSAGDPNKLWLDNENDLSERQE